MFVTDSTNVPVLHTAQKLVYLELTKTYRITFNAFMFLVCLNDHY